MAPEFAFAKLSEFDRDVKELTKRYRHANEDVLAVQRFLSADLKARLHPAEVGGFGQRKIWKGRAINQDVQKGKSSGYRIWWLERPAQYVFIYLYVHADEEDEHRIRQEVARRLRVNGY